jgi:hypothetical protein
MRRITTPAVACAAACLTFAATAFAAAIPNSAVIHERVFVSCPTSTVSTTNLFPASVTISDQNNVPPFCAGFAEMHTWRFSTDGTNDQQFMNGDTFEYSATVHLNGAGEGGLSLAPWWAPQSDGLFNCRTTDGEIAVFGGRLPFFSFTGQFGLLYLNDTDIQLGISYFPNGLSGASPGQVVYNVRYNGTNYTSGLLSFDEGNVGECCNTNPPHGLWGALSPWYAGGQMKMFLFPSNPPQPHGIAGSWTEIQYLTGPVATSKSSWGQIKQLYR